MIQNLSPIYAVPMRNRIYRVGRHGIKTAEDFARRVCGHMDQTGKNAILFERDGELRVSYSDSLQYQRMAEAPRGRRCVVGFYTPAVSVEEMAGDVGEFFA